MNTLIFNLGWHLRRLQLPTLTLLVLLQRTPVLRLLALPPSAWISAPLGQTLRAGALVAAALGAVDTVAGATTFSANPASPAAATVGTTFGAVFSILGGNTAGSYTLSNTIPPGLTVPNATFNGTRYLLNKSTCSITGTPTTAGSYIVAITAWENTNATGASISLNYTINVAGPAATAPGITTHPASQTVNVGTPVTFSVTATGTAPLTYTWFRGTTQLATGTSSTYAIASTQTTDAGSYTVNVSNSAGNLTSNAATLTVNKLAQTITFAGPADQGFGFTPIALAATSDSGLTPTFTYLSGPASLNGSTLTLTGLGTVTVRADQAGNDVYAAATSVTRSFNVTADFAYWQLQNFDATELSLGTLTGATTVVTADGLPNLAKYALGLAAKTPATTLPAAGSANGNWTFSYRRPTGQTDVTAAVEASADLVNWSSANVTLGSISNGDGTDTWTATVPQSSAANLYFRLKVTRP